ncbi:hypothetical protein T08_15845 [Trichinella sp. T8]|nr:hypothetical protein T08_15845 [Trichinella sp. T8]
MCYERNDTDLVRVTQPWAGAQWSRVEHEQCPRTAGQIAILASGGTGLGSARPTAATLIALRFKNVDRLCIIFRSEQDSFDGAPRRPFRAGQQVRELGGIVQLTPFMNTGLELGPKGREFQHLPCKLRESHLRQPPVSDPDRWPASTAVVAANGAADITSPTRLSRTDALLLPSLAPFRSGVRLQPEKSPPSGKPAPPPRRHRLTLYTTPLRTPRYPRSVGCLFRVDPDQRTNVTAKVTASNKMLKYKSARRSLVRPMEVDCMRWGGYGCNVLWRSRVTLPR